MAITCAPLSLQAAISEVTRHVCDAPLSSHDAKMKRGPTTHKQCSCLEVHALYNRRQQPLDTATDMLIVLELSPLGV